VSGDALYCQRNLCGQIVAAGGDYVIVVKRNQPQLYEDIELLFTQPPSGEMFFMASQGNRHGDRSEMRHLWASTALRDYVDWPGVEQVYRIKRRTERTGKVSQEVRYGITSLGEDVGAWQLLGYVRGHWAIENRLHYVRDVTFGEDGCQVRTGSAPEVMAALRNVVIALLRRAGWENIAAGLRHYAWQPNAALNLLGLIET
jgi:predicted transposase YbfD/YdcC